MNNLLPVFRVTKEQYYWLKTIYHTKTKESHNKILSLKSPEITEEWLIRHALVRYSKRFSYAHWSYYDEGDSISFILRKTEVSPTNK